mmetsp:Transcript_8157/g.20451  ORF Transcript_8157/g.20451 Transcript_8157/m.20451 type:complete len:225 (-) Transcript_8157:683-1357(-)
MEGRRTLVHGAMPSAGSAPPLPVPPVLRHRRGMLLHRRPGQSRKENLKDGGLHGGRRGRGRPEGFDALHCHALGLDGGALPRGPHPKDCQHRRLHDSPHVLAHQVSVDVARPRLLLHAPLCGSGAWVRRMGYDALRRDGPRGVAQCLRCHQLPSFRRPRGTNRAPVACGASFRTLYLRPPCCESLPQAVCVLAGTHWELREQRACATQPAGDGNVVLAWAAALR